MTECMFCGKRIGKWDRRITEAFPEPNTWTVSSWKDSICTECWSKIKDNKKQIKNIILEV